MKVEESVSGLKRTRPLSRAEEEGGDGMEWVRKKILKNVEIEGNAKITASRAIQNLIKQNMDERLRLNNCINKARGEIENEKAGMADLDIKEAVAENDLTEIDLKMADLESARQESLRTLGIVQASIKTKEEKIAERSHQVSTWNQQVLDSKRQLIELEEDLEALPTEIGYNQQRLQLLEKQISSLQKDLKCPICFNPCTSPIFSCPAQHPVCSTCRPKLEDCGICREPYLIGMARHRYAEKQSVHLAQIQKEFTRCSRGFPVKPVLPPEDEGSTNDPSREKRRQATREVLQQLRDTRRNK